MKKIVSMILGIAVVAMATAQGPHDETTIAKEGSMAPGFTVEMLDGSTVSLENLRGKVVVLNFWATWCPYCIQELDVVQEGLIERYKDEDVVFLAVSRGEKRKTVEKFVEKKGYAFPVGLDPEQDVWNLYATKSIPRNFVIDRDGKISKALLGYSEEEFRTLLGAVDELLEK